MRSGNVLAFDPNQAAVTGAQTLIAGAGGGLIAGNGTYYSRPTRLDSSVHASDVIKTTGTVAGTLTIEVMNDDENVDGLGNADWNTYDRVNGAGFTSGVATLVAGSISGGTNPEGVELKDITFAAYRYKLVVTGGTGSIKIRRALKGF